MHRRNVGRQRATARRAAPCAFAVLALLHQRARQRQARVEAARIGLGRVGRHRHGVGRMLANAQARQLDPRCRGARIQAQHFVERALRLVVASRRPQDAAAHELRFGRRRVGGHRRLGDLRRLVELVLPAQQVGLGGERREFFGCTVIAWSMIVMASSGRPSTCAIPASRMLASRAETCGPTASGCSSDAASAPRFRAM